MAKPVCGADNWTDYRLDVNLLNLHVNHKARKRLDVSKLKQDKRQTFLIDICNNVGALQLSSEDPEGNWTVFQNAFHSSAFDTLGHKPRKILLMTNTAYTRYTKTILAQYRRRQPVARADLGTCVFPG